jgi:hypothetical protein
MKVMRGMDTPGPVVNYILQVKLIGGLGGDEDPLPPDGGNPHPLQNVPFGGIWDDLVDGNNPMGENVAPNMGNVAHGGNVAPAADGEPVDALSAFHKMLTDVLTTFPDALDKLNHESVTSARIQMVDATSDGYAERKCIVSVYTAQEAPIAKSSVTISEIYDNAEETVGILSALNTSANVVVDLDPMGSDIDMADTLNEQHLTSTTPIVTPAYKRKNEEVPVDVKEVRRSR